MRTYLAQRESGGWYYDPEEHAIDQAVVFPK